MGLFRTAAAIGAAFILVACAGAPTPSSTASPSQVQTYAKGVLDTLLPKSFVEEREFCGYIFVRPDGSLAHTTPRPGRVDFCDYGPAPVTTVASFHTHGHYLPGFDSEIPSFDDARGSVDIGYDDYLGTPGGRFWVIGADGRSSLLCGVGCLPSDPNYREDPTLPVDNAYTVRELLALQS